MIRLPAGPAWPVADPLGAFQAFEADERNWSVRRPSDAVDADFSRLLSSPAVKSALSRGAGN